MTISIIIPMYDRATLIGETLDSISAQSLADWECIVVDDGSTDGSSEIVQNYVRRDVRFRLFARPGNKPKGAPTCRNIGFEKSTGEYVYFFDSDDLLGPDFLQGVLAGMPPEADCAVFPFDGFDAVPDEPIYRSRKYLAGRGSLFEQAMTGRVILRTQTLFFRKTLLERAGMLWRENFRSSFDDVDFTKRMMLEAENPVWIDMMPSVHIRFGNIDSLVGETKRTPGKAVEDRLFVEHEIFLACRERGRMKKSLRRGMMRSLLRSQLIQALFLDNERYLYLYGKTLRNFSDRSPHDRFLLVVSASMTFFSPLLRLVGAISCRLPRIGRVFRRIRHK